MSESESPRILIGGNENTQVWMPTAMANRHGMIAGATGTGKTVSLQILAESFPVWVCPALWPMSKVIYRV